MKTYNENLNWRYATKVFDHTKKVASKDLEQLMESIRLTASSYGLQPYEVLIIEDLKTREALQPAALNQSQITGASHLIVFASRTKIDKEYIESYLQNISKTRSIPDNDLHGFREILENTILKLSPAEQLAWASRQTYIALGNFLSAAANLKIDTCPMEGFDPEGFDKILDLKQRDLTTTVIAPIGYRSANDKNQFAPKVRKTEKQLFQFI